MHQFNKLLISVVILLIFGLGCNSEDKTGDATFLELNSETTGLSFKNQISENDSINFMTYPFLYYGGGVGVGDFNRDGLPDLVFTGMQSGIGIYMNKGDFQFQAHSFNNDFSEPSGFFTGINVIDINNDGFDDIYICRSSMEDQTSRTNLLFLNDGNGGFEEKAGTYGLDSDHRSSQSVFLDYDKDGDLDLFIANHPIDFKNSGKRRFTFNTETKDYERILEPKSEFDSDQLFLNNGDGTFTETSQQAGINNYGFSLNVNVVDINEDSYPDIFITNEFVEPDLLYVNQKDGTFKSDLGSYFHHISRFSKGSSWADINNDGKEDLFVVDQLPDQLERKKKLRSVLNFNQYYTLTELGYDPQITRNTLQLNLGEGQFSEIAQMTNLSASDWSFGPMVGDFDNDGLKDVFITNGLRRDLNDCDYSVFKADSIRRAGAYDIRQVLRLIPEQPQQNKLFMNQGYLLFEDQKSVSVFNPSFSTGVAKADLNNDGALDLVVNNVDDHPTIYKNRLNTEKGYVAIELNGPLSNRGAIGAKVLLYQDGNLQIQTVQPIQGIFSSSDYKLHFGVVVGTPIERVEIQWPNGNSSIMDTIQANRSYTFNYSETSPKRKLQPYQFRKPMVKEAMNILDHTSDENELHDLLRQPLMPHSVSNLGPAIAVADLNKDGIDDLYIGGPVNQSGKLFLSENGRYKDGIDQPFASDLKSEDVDAVFIDIDEDSDLDLYVVSGGNAFLEEDASYYDRLYINEGNLQFVKSSGIIPDLANSGSKVLPFDYDADGDLDLLVGSRILPGKYPFSPRNVILENEDGIFKDRTKEMAPEIEYLGMVTDAEYIDLDNDNQNELVLAGEYLSIKVFAFDGEKFFEKEFNGLDASEGWWNVLEAVDLDADGDLDLIAGNHGLNSMYKASIENPLTVHASDFDLNGSIDPIICMTNDDSEFPLAQRRDIINQIPKLERKLKRYSTYASMDVQEMLGDMGLDNALRLRCTMFETTVFMNNGDRTFNAFPLPAEAQFTPVFEILAVQNETKGKTGILLGGNLEWVNIESGPYDAGYLQYYEYDPEDGFALVSSEELGVHLTGEIRKIIPININGIENILVGTSKEKLRILEWNN